MPLDKTTVVPYYMHNLNFLDKTSRKRLSWGKAGQKNLYLKTFISWARNLAKEPKINFLKSRKLHYSSHFVETRDVMPSPLLIHVSPICKYTRISTLGKERRATLGKSKISWLRRREMKNPHFQCSVSTKFDKYCRCGILFPKRTKMITELCPCISVAGHGNYELNWVKKDESRHSNWLKKYPLGLIYWHLHAGALQICPSEIVKSCHYLCISLLLYLGT